MGLSDGAFFMIKHTPLPNENHPILSPICPMGVADTLEHCPNVYTVPDGTQVCVQINNAEGSIQYLTIDHLQYLISSHAEYLI